MERRTLIEDLRRDAAGRQPCWPVRRLPQETIKIGASAPKTGPLAGGAAVTYWPAIQLWVHDVNERGGIDVGGTKMKVELGRI